MTGAPLKPIESETRGGSCAPAPCYATAIWVLESAAEDRDKTAQKLRDWADERGSRSVAESDVLDKLWREAKELRAAIKVIESHND